MNSFTLEILTPERTFFKGECVSLVLPITDGMLGIMANRAPITASISCGEGTYTLPDGKKIVFSISGGMLEVAKNHAELLCDSALLPEEIDEVRELEKAENARLELSKKQSHKDYLLSQIMLSDAINNLKVKQKTSIN